MTDHEIATERTEFFAELDEQLAAEVRQLFRAHLALDTKAEEVCLMHFRHSLIRTLEAHLKKDSRWDSGGRWLEGLGVALPELQPSHRLGLRDQLTWVTRDQKDWYYEPFDFNLELWPDTGVLRRCTFRFGNQQPLADKELRTRTEMYWPRTDGDWAFIIRRGEKEEPAPTSGTIMDRRATIMQFPILTAAESLRGKPPAELPHGFIPIPPDVRQLVEEERPTWSPEAFAKSQVGELWMLNYWTLDFYFDDLGYEVIYRETPDGPVVVAVGSDETIPLMRKQAACGEPHDLKFYNG